MSKDAYLEQIQDLIAEEVADALLGLDIHPGISEETRLNLAVDIAVASAYRCALGDAIDKLRDSNRNHAAALIAAMPADFTDLAAPGEAV